MIIEILKGVSCSSNVNNGIIYHGRVNQANSNRNQKGDQDLSETMMRALGYVVVIIEDYIYDR
jgi:hypothetical protein